MRARRGTDLGPPGEGASVPSTGANPLSTGDFFRGLWGPHAGWAQAVSTLLGTLGLSPCYALWMCPPHPLSMCQVLFCADLRKDQELARNQDRPRGSRGQDNHGAVSH